MKAALSPFQHAFVHAGDRTEMLCPSQASTTNHMLGKLAHMTLSINMNGENNQMCEPIVEGLLQFAVFAMFRLPSCWFLLKASSLPIPKHILFDTTLMKPKYYS